MKDPKAIFKVKKKTIYKVLFFHFIFILFLSFHSKFQIKKEPKALSINTIVLKEKKIPQKIVKKTSPKKIKKIVKTQKPQLKKTKKINSPNKLLDQLEKEIAKLEKISEKKEILSSKALAPNTLAPNVLVPKELEELNISSKFDSNLSKEKKYKQILIQELQKNLKLPEYGKVKLSFSINLDGSISDIFIVESKSKKNEIYLKNSLPEISFSWFNQMFDKPQNFVIIFKNE